MVPAPCKVNPENGADHALKVVKFGDFATADHTVLNEENESRTQQTYAAVVQDLAMQWIQSCPCQQLKCYQACVDSHYEKMVPR